MNAIDIRRALFQLKEAGWFDNAKGFLIGRPLHSEFCFDVGPEECVLDLLSPLGLPILYNVDLGHISPALPILSGAEGKVSLEEGNLHIQYK